MCDFLYRAMEGGEDGMGVSKDPREVGIEFVWNNEVV